MTQQTQKITALLNEIKVISSELPKGKSHMVHNRCSKIRMVRVLLDAPMTEVTGPSRVTRAET